MLYGSIAIGILVVLFGGLYYLKRVKESANWQHSYQNNLALVESLPNDRAQEIAETIIGRGNTFIGVVAEQPIPVPPSLGPIAASYLSRFRELRAVNGSIVLSSGLLANSKYGKGFVALGYSDYLDVAVKASNDQVFFLDGSLSEILCVRHNMLPRSMYAKQDEQEEGGGRTAVDSERSD